MNLLLDTHVLLWAESSHERLGPETRALLLDPSHSLWISPVSALELSRLISLSRLALRRPLQDWMDTARRHLAFRTVPFTDRIAIGSYELPGEFHKDPADRILVATARELGYPLLTADDLILRYPHVEALDARK